jgi:ubiquinone/menaquinone biosynthesis C-methylase UbiE
VEVTATTRFRDAREVKAWNDAMVVKYDLDRFHAHPSPLVRFVEARRLDATFRLLDAQPGDRVLEVGCGAGHLLARLPAGRAFGIDLAESLLARTRARVGGRAVLAQADAAALPFTAGAFERVYCSEVLEHLVDPRAAVAEIARVLTPGGVAVLSVPNERLINRAKALVRTLGLWRLVMRGSEYDMPERMDDEWHLHTFDASGFRALVPPALRITRLVGVPAPALALRWVMRCEARP